MTTGFTIHLQFVAALIVAAPWQQASTVGRAYASELAIYTLAPRINRAQPSEIHQFADNGDYVQRWDAPATRYFSSMATDGTSLYVAERRGVGGNEPIEKYSLEGVYLGQFADVASQAGNSPNAPSLESDQAGDLYICYGGQGSTPRTSFRLDPQGNISQTFSHPSLVFPDGIDAAADGSVFIVHGAGIIERLYRFSARGDYIADFPIPEVGSASDLAIHEATDELFIADEFSEAIHVYDISSPTPVYLGPISVPLGVTDISIEPTTGRIFGTNEFATGAFEVSRDGSLNMLLPFPPSPHAIGTVVAVAVPESSQMVGAWLTLFVVVTLSRYRQREHALLTTKMNSEKRFYPWLRTMYCTKILVQVS